MKRTSLCTYMEIPHQKKEHDTRRYVMLYILHHDAAYKYANSISEPNFTFGNPIEPSWSSHFIHKKLDKKNGINNTI